MVNFGFLGYSFPLPHDIIESWKGREKQKLPNTKTIKQNIQIVIKNPKNTNYDLYNIRKVQEVLVMMAAVKKMIERIASFTFAVVMTTAMAAYIPANAAEELTDERAHDLVKEVEILVNEAREEAGLKPLYVLPYLEEVAEIRALESSMSFSHTRTNGTGFETTIDTSIVSYGLASENLAGGFGTAEEIFELWRNSSGHWANIMNPDITHMGVGVVYDGNSQYGYYWEQVFIATDVDYADQFIPSEEEVNPTIAGDVDGDGVVDVFDCLVIREYLKKKKEHYPVYFNAAQIESADCFDDGIITEADAKTITRFVLGEYKNLPFVF